MPRSRVVRPAIPGQLKAEYGCDEPGGRPDLVFAWGEGCSKADGSVLHTALQHTPVLDGRSLVDVLLSRGYDIATLKFSVSKRKGE